MKFEIDVPDELEFNGIRGFIYDAETKSLIFMPGAIVMSAKKMPNVRNSGSVSITQNRVTEKGNFISHDFIVSITGTADYVDDQICSVESALANRKKFGSNDQG